MSYLCTILASPFTLFLCIISLIFLFRKKLIELLVKAFIELIHNEQKKRRPKRIILIRHGHSMANYDYDILQNIPDNKVTLTEKGEDQAREAGKKLKKLIGNESIQFYISPYKRTQQTYNFILESLKSNPSNCIISTALREQEYGNLQNDMEKQFDEQKTVGEFFYRFKGGESGADVHSRMSIFLQYLFRRILSIDYKGWENIIIISHALTIKVFMMNFLNLPVKEYDNIKKLDNAEYWIIEKNEYGKYKVKDDIFINKKE